MAIFRRRRGHPILSVIAAVLGAFYFADDAETDQYYTDDALADPLIYEDE